MFSPTLTHKPSKTNWKPKDGNRILGLLHVPWWKVARNRGPLACPLHVSRRPGMCVTTQPACLPHQTPSPAPGPSIGLGMCTLEDDLAEWPPGLWSAPSLTSGPPRIFPSAACSYLTCHCPGSPQMVLGETGKGLRVPHLERIQCNFAFSCFTHITSAPCFV